MRLFPSSPSSQIKSLEDDIHATLAMLRRHINPLGSPLYRLPPDLFPEIASHLTNETDLINATHTSYHLRSTLLSYPSLWSHLDFEHEARARAFFERSGRAPLHIDMVRDITRTVESLAELRQQSNRIATLKLRHWWVQKKFLSEPLPSLRRLEIFFDYCYDEEWDEEWDTVWAPVWGPIKEATSWAFPSLTSLVVYNLGFIPFYVPHLTCFKFWDRESTSHANRLIKFLNECPLLQHINISYLGGLRSNHDLVVSLPNLQTYTETTFDGACPLTVFNALSLPPFCSVTLRFRGDSEMATAVNNPLPNFENPDYLTGIKRVKLGTTQDAGGNDVAETLELISAKGTKVCSVRAIFEEEDEEGYQQALDNAVHLNFLRNLNGRSVEILCIDGYASQDIGAVPVEFLKEALGFGNVKTLILSRSVVGPCLSALNEDPGASDSNRWFLPINTLIIYTGQDPHDSRHKILPPLLNVARRRQVAGFPFKRVSLFLSSTSEWHWDSVLKGLKSCVGELEVVAGDDVLDWDLDKYFLDGLEHLQKNRDVRWD